MPGRRSAWQRFAFVWMCGATIAPIGDHFHVARGVTEYLTDFGPVWLGNSPLWFVVLCAGFLATVAVVRSARIAPVRGTASRTFISPLFVLAVYLTTSFYPWREGGSLEAVCFASAIGLWLALDRTRTGFLVALLAAAIATGFEWVLVQIEIIRYLPQSDELGGVAAWLPALYFAAATCAGGMGRRLTNGSTTCDARSGRPRP